MAELLARQIREPVRWWESMSTLIELGVDDVLEVGPGRVLTDLWSAVRRQPCPRPRRRRSRRRGDGRRRAAATAAGTAGTAAGTAAVSGTRTGGSGSLAIRPESIGSAEFRDEYGIRYAYLAGAMYRGIASVPLVVRMARAGLMGFFGAGGLSTEEVDGAIRAIRAELGPDGRLA